MHNVKGFEENAHKMLETELKKFNNGGMTVERLKNIKCIFEALNEANEYMGMKEGADMDVSIRPAGR